LALIFAALPILAWAKGAPFALVDCNSQLHTAKKISLGQNFQIKLPDGSLRAVSVLGSYAGEVLFAQFPGVVYKMARNELEGLGYQIELFDFPTITRQTGPECLPTSVAYIQKLFGKQSTLVNCVPERARISFMSMFMIYNPALMFNPSGPKIQMNIAETALRLSGLSAHSTSKFEDLAEHFSKPGFHVALVGLRIGPRALYIGDLSTGREDFVGVLSPSTGFPQGLHAMVLTSYVGSDGNQGFMLIDPNSGAAVPAGLEGMAENFKNAELIDTPLN
jgi:hypothetical protein